MIQPGHERGMQLVDVLDGLLDDRQLPTSSSHRIASLTPDNAAAGPRVLRLIQSYTHSV